MVGHNDKDGGDSCRDLYGCDVDLAGCWLDDLNKRICKIKTDYGRIDR